MNSFRGCIVAPLLTGSGPATIILTMMWEPYAEQWAGLLLDDARHR